jgi:sugar lactone lactonase YvrE
VVSGVLRNGIGLGALAAMLACTAPNPMYNRQDGTTTGADAGEEPGPDGSGATLTRADAALPPGCGSVHADTSALALVDSLTVDLGGTIYFNVTEGTRAFIGRLTANSSTPEPHWAAIPMGLPTRGLTVDGARNILYFSAGMAPAVIQAIDLGAPTPVARTVSAGFTDPNDLAVSYEDGSVYVSEQGDAHIWRFPARGGMREQVTVTPLGQPPDSGPAGLAFAPDHTLVVGMKPSDRLVRLSLDDKGLERRRASFGKVHDWVNALAFDERGRLYVALWTQRDDQPKQVLRLDSDEADPVEVLGGGRFSTLVFGRGPLDCKDLYVAEPYAVVARLPAEFPGLPVP